MLLRVEHTVHGDTASITAEGEIDLATVNKLRSAITNALSADVRRVVLDMDRVTYIDSSGLGTLIGAHKRLAAMQGTLTVRCSQPRVLRLFALTGVDQVLHVVPHDDASAATALPKATPA